VEKAGRVFVFTSTDVRYGNWDHAAVLTASDGAINDLFGNSVRMPNQNTIVVGAPGESPEAATAGSIYVFTGYDSNWDQVQKISYTGSAAGNKFGLNRAMAATQKEIFAGSSDEPTFGLHSNNPEKVIRYRI